MNALRLFALALLGRLGRPRGHCPYCGAICASRFPWQAVAPHVASAHPLPQR